MRKRRFTVVMWLAAVAFAVPPVSAERLAVHTYTVADGLAGDQVLCIEQDRQGFLWIGSSTGLSRFDGVSFRSFDSRDGLPHPAVHDILEDSTGSLWVATGRGLVRMRAERGDDRGAFELADGIPGSVHALAEDEDGVVWATSAGTLYRLAAGGVASFESVPVEVSWLPGHPRAIEALAPAADGGLWLGTNAGLYRVSPDGGVVRLNLEQGDRPWRVSALTRDSAERLWVAGRGVAVLVPQPLQTDDVPVRWLDSQAAPRLPTDPGDALRLDRAFEFVREKVFGIDEAPDGEVWLAGYGGLAVVGSDDITWHHRRNGLVSDHLGPILVDASGNVWIGTQSHGLMRVNSTGFTTYTQEDGLASRKTASIVRGPSGEVVVIGYPPEHTIHVRQARGFTPLQIPLPGDVPVRGWGLNQVTLFDHQGQLWVPTVRGLAQFPRFERLSDLPSARFQRRLLPDNEIFRVFEDSRGDVWIGALGDTRTARWEREADAVHHYGAEHGIPFEPATAFAEDRSGAVWIGFYSGGVARWKDDAFELFGGVDGLATGFVNCLLVDHEGRLWLGSRADGLSVTRDPTARTPVWRLYSTADGLSSNGIYSLAEDRFGRIYAGSLKGIDRLDPTTGVVEHFDTSTGLVNNLVISAMTGPDGDLWFATDGGVSRYRPTERTPRPAPAVFIDRLTVDGADLAAPLRAVASIPPVSLDPGTHIVDVGFAAVDLTPGSRLDFELSVDSEHQSWSSTNGQRSVRLAGLAAGRHRVSIRARLPDGTTGTAASVDLEIALPVWRRWWFLTSVAAAVTGAAWLVHRWRIRRLVELQRVRSRIAADLHDEMGLSLARVAILADVAGRGDGANAVETLQEIGGTARDLVDATSDMAWALDPRHDTVAALVARLRRMANDVVEGCGARFELEADPLDGVPMESETRRHLLLILKEAIRNACRHGRPDTVVLTIERHPTHLAVSLADDGSGFDPKVSGEGQGLASMQRRADEIGARLGVESAFGEGSTIRLEVPFEARA